MGYFRNLPDILYQSPLPHKVSTQEFIQIKNIFRRSKVVDYVNDNITLFQKYILEDGDRPDSVAEALYKDPELDYVVVIVAGITNINHQWPLQDFQMYDFTLSKYGTEAKMNDVHHYETYEIRDSQNRQILPPNLIVDKDFKIDGSALRFGGNRFTVINQTGNIQLDDKNEYTVITDNIAAPVTNFEHEISINDKNREIDVLREDFVLDFVAEFKNTVRYARNSRYISDNLVRTENTNIIP